jgi:hypothetical protein
LSPSALLPLPRRAFIAQPHVDFSDTRRLTPLKLQYLPHPVFERTEDLEEIVRSTHLAKSADAIPHDQVWMGIHFDMEIEKGLHPPFAVRWIDEKTGFGVFALQRHLPCSMVGEYTGLIRQKKTPSIRESTHSFDVASWATGQRHYVIDAEKMGNFTRLIHPSDHPNIGAQWVYWRGWPRLIFIALEEISEETLLTIHRGHLFNQQAPRLRPDIEY